MSRGEGDVRIMSSIPDSPSDLSLFVPALAILREIPRPRLHDSRGSSKLSHPYRFQHRGPPCQSDNSSRIPAHYLNATTSSRRSGLCMQLPVTPAIHLVRRTIANVNAKAISRICPSSIVSSPSSSLQDIFSTIFWALLQSKALLFHPSYYFSKLSLPISST